MPVQWLVDVYCYLAHCRYASTQSSVSGVKSRRWIMYKVSEHADHIVFPLSLCLVASVHCFQDTFCS
jgi:hypothetical protein